MESKNHFVLAVQGKTTEGRGRESHFGGRGYGGNHSGGQGEVIYCYYCKESGHTKYNCPLLQQKQQQFQSAHIATAQEQQFNSKSPSMRSR